MKDRIIQCLNPIPQMEDWGAVDPVSDLRNAAVLVPIVERDALNVLLTLRTDHLHHHPGQVSFPGGRADAVDRSPLDTALRETEEEVGILREQIEIVGTIGLYQTVTSFNVVPVVGFVQPDYTLDIDTFEVAEVFEVPLEALDSPEKYRRETIFWEGEWREYWQLYYQDYRIWGATAAMLYELSTRLHDLGYT